MGIPARAFMERRLRLYPYDDPPTGDPILAGSPVTLTAGEVDLATTASILGFAAEAADPDNDPAFTRGGGNGGAFIVDVHPAEVLIMLGQSGATFLMSYYDDASADSAPSEPPDSIVGTTLGISALADGTWVVDGDSGAGGEDIAAAVEVVSIVKVASNSPTVSLVEVALVSPQLM